MEKDLEAANVALVLADASTASGASGSVAGPVVESGDTPANAPKARCQFECGPPMPLKDMIRSNPRAAPMCHPCYNAQRALKAAVAKNSSHKAALAKMCIEDPEMWKAKVRGCRIIDPSAGGQCGVASGAARRAEIHKFVTTLTQTVGVEERGGVIWLKESEFVHHMKTYEGKTDSEASDLWKEKSAEPGAMQMPGDAVRVPVMKPPETDVYRKRELSKSLASTIGVVSQAQADDATKQLANVGVGMAALSGPLFGDMTGVLRPGVAVGSSSGQPLPLIPLQAPPSQMVVPSSAFEGAVPKAKRSLSAQISNPEGPEEPAKKRKGPGGSALAGVTGQLLQLRTRGLDACAQIWEQFGKVGKNVARPMEASLKAATFTAPAELSKAVRDYSSGLVSVKTLEKQIKFWTQEDAKEKLLDLASLAETLENCHKIISQGQAELKAQQETARKEAAKARNETNKLRARLTSAYKGTVPDVLIRYLYDSGALVSSAASSDPDGTDAAGSEPSDSGPLGQLKVRCPVVTHGETEFRQDEPAFFAPPVGGVEVAEASVGKQVRSIVEHVGVDRVAEAEKECLRAIANSGITNAKKQLPPKGQPSDTFELMEWVPEHWRASKIMPEQMRGMGAPRLYISMVGDGNFDHEDWTIPGIGQFLIAVRGHITVVTWPGDSVLRLGCPIADMNKFLFKNMNNKTFSEWADKHMKFVNLQDRGSMWMPYGWFCAALSRPGTSTASTMLAVPYITKALSSKCAWWPQVSGHLQTCVRSLMKNGKKSWQECGGAALEWLQVVDGQQKAFSATPALQDGDARSVEEQDTQDGNAKEGEGEA